MILVASGRYGFEGRNTQPRCVSQETVALARFHLTPLGKRKLRTWTPEHTFGIGDRGTHEEKVPQICHQLITYKSQGRHRATSIQLAVLWNSRSTALNTMHTESPAQEHPGLAPMKHEWAHSSHGIQPSLRA